MLVYHHNCPLILNQFFKPLYSKDLERLRTRQRHISMISEMYHTASLVHDDVIDRADLRRGKESLNKVWGQRNSVLTGDFIVSISNKLLAQLDDPVVSTQQQTS